MRHATHLARQLYCTHQLPLPLLLSLRLCSLQASNALLQLNLILLQQLPVRLGLCERQVP